MKTSNKILLALAGLLFVSFTANEVGLYSKLKAGSFITEEQMRDREREFRMLQKFNSINIEGFNGINIIPSDSFGIRINYDDTSNVRYELKNEQLTIHHNKNELGRDWIQVEIYCPSTTTFNLRNSSLYLENGNWKYFGGKISDNSQVYLNSKIDSVNVEAKDESTLELSENSVIGILSLNLLENANLNVDAKSRILQFGNINLSDTARIEAPGRVLNGLMNKNTQK